MTNERATKPAQQISLYMQQQLDLINGYIDYLDNIKQTVTQNDVGRLNELLRERSPNLHLIEQIQQQQGNLLVDHGYQNDHAGLEQFISERHLPALVELKTRLQERLQKLEKSLLVNDLLIRKNQQRVRQSIRLLAGHQASDAMTTYSREGGNPAPDGVKRKLAEV